MLDKLQQLLVPFVHAIYFKLVFQVALCLLKVQFIELSCFCWLFKKCASTGNRSLVYRAAGDKSTTEPSMLDKLQQLLVPFVHAIVFTLVFQVVLCVSWMFKLSSSPVFVYCSKMYIDRESNPCLSRGRRQIYHWTIDAWQIATITGSFHTCNLFHVGFPSCSVFVESSIYRALPFLLIVQKMCIDWESNPGLSRGRRQFYHWTIDAWQIATITGSFHTCNLFQVGFPGCSVFVESSIYRALLFLLIVQKMCIDRQSKLCLSCGRRQTYHRTIDAWQIATITGSVHTCNCIHLGFSGCSLCQLNVQIEFSHFCWLFKIVLPPGIEPFSIAWQATILPLNHWCLTNWNTFWFFQTCHLFQVSFLGCSVFLKSSIYRALPILLIVQKMYIHRESNPFLSRGRRQFYHWTIDAWQIGTLSGSFRHAIYFKLVF